MDMECRRIRKSKGGSPSGDLQRGRLAGGGFFVVFAFTNWHFAFQMAVVGVNSFRHLICYGVVILG